MAFYGPDNDRGATFLTSPDHVGAMVEVIPGAPDRTDGFGRVRNIALD
jgi:hypothetical protein